MDERLGAGAFGCLGNVPRAIDMNRLHLAPEYADEVHRGDRPVERAPDVVRIGDVGSDEAELPDRTERLDCVGAARIALRHAHSDAAPEQIFADVAADETAAAEDGDKLF